MTIWGYKGTQSGPHACEWKPTTIRIDAIASQGFWIVRFPEREIIVRDRSTLTRMARDYARGRNILETEICFWDPSHE